MAAVDTKIQPAASSLLHWFRHEVILALILVIALFLLATQTDRFLTTENLLNQGRLMAEVGLVALPMTFIIITAGIDLSVGSILGLTAILLGVAWKNVGLPLEVALIVALGVGTFAGFLNGWFITAVNVPPLIMTLATLALYRGLAEGISQARSVRGYPDWFFQLGQGEIFGVPTQLWILLIAIVIAWLTLAYTSFGTVALRDRSQRSGRPFLRHSGRSLQADHLHAFGVHGGTRRLHFRLTREHHAFRYGHGIGARCDCRRRPRRDQHLRRRRHDRRHDARLHHDPALEERPVADGGEGRCDDRRHRFGSDPVYPLDQLHQEAARG